MIHEGRVTWFQPMSRWKKNMTSDLPSLKIHLLEVGIRSRNLARYISRWWFQMVLYFLPYLGK